MNHFLNVFRIIRLEDIGKGFKPAVSGGTKSVDVDDDDDGVESSSQMKRRLPHCSRCGHPGSKRSHFKSSCEHCSSDSGCIKKPLEFTCECSFCTKDRELKEQKKTENWWIKVCDRIALGPDFPNRKIIQLYLSDSFTGMKNDLITVVRITLHDSCSET